MSLPPGTQHRQVQDRLLRCECMAQDGEVGLPRCLCMQDMTGSCPWSHGGGPRAPGKLVFFCPPSQQCNDVGLMAYLGTITKTCNTMNQFREQVQRPLYSTRHRQADAGALFLTKGYFLKG